MAKRFLNNHHEWFVIFVRTNIAMSVTLLMFRIYQFFVLGKEHIVPDNLVLLELAGFFSDLFTWLLVSLILLVPFILLCKWSSVAGNMLLKAAGALFLLIETALFRYFLEVLIPLDEVVFSYSLPELFMISRSSVSSGVNTFLPTILAILAFILIGSVRLRLQRRFVNAVLIVSAASPFVLLAGNYIPLRKNNPHAYAFTVNKTGYFTARCMIWVATRSPEPGQQAVNDAAARYQAGHPELKFPGVHYPFLHYDETPDVLSPFFNLGPEPPNLVFVIMESLSTCFVGNNPFFGSFTPFIDSLAAKGLFWNNFLSTSDRTFNVLPALFGSLPPGDPSVMVDINRMPVHLSLIRLLNENGYFSSFFYGGDPSFNNMEEFLLHQGTGFILRPVGTNHVIENDRNDHTGWGYPDGFVYSRSLQVIDSMAKSPRLDIYLTLSLHSPFKPPDREQYLAEVARRRGNFDPKPMYYEDSEKYRDIFATILYTDDALRNFFNAYRQRPDFKNTIFIITGDHGLPELGVHRISPIYRYNVPLLIYSPMLREPRLMMAVSSHLDVTPSLLAMLKTHYRIKTRPVVHWLGSGLDTVRRAQNTREIAFILNSKEIREYLNKDYFFNTDQLFRFDPGFWLRETPDPPTFVRMAAKLADFKTLNTFTTRQNRLMPEEVFFEKVLDSLVIPIPDPVYLNPADSLSEFRSFFNQLPVPPEMQILRLDISVDILTHETDPEKAPVVVFDLYAHDGSHLTWNSFRFSCFNDGTVRPGTWRTIHLQEYVKLNHLHREGNSSLMLYLWNRSRSIIRFNNPKVTITGYF